MSGLLFYKKEDNNGVIVTINLNRGSGCFKPDPACARTKVFVTLDFYSDSDIFSGRNAEKERIKLINRGL